jgi:hypothetical protein
VLDPASLLGVGEQRVDLAVGPEAEELQQLRRLGDDPNRQVPCAVEPVPVALLAERAGACLERAERRLVVDQGLNLLVA